MSLSKTNCHKCVHSRSNSFVNSAHVHCAMYWAYYKKNKSAHPKGAEHAIKSGWWDFPYDYDPIWMQGECERFEEKSVLPESKL